MNEFVYELAKFARTRDGARIIEGEGGGVREVRAALAEAGMADPVFHDSGVSFVARLSRRIHGRAVVESYAPARVREVVQNVPTRNGDAILAVLTDPRTFAEIVEATGLTGGQVRYALRRLIESKHVVLEGAHGVRGSRYRRA